MEHDAGGWFYEANGQALGPVPLPQLIAMFRARKLGPQTVVWTAAMTQRLPAAMLPAIASQIPDDGGALNLLIPIGPQSGLAIAAGYLGLLSLLGLPGPLALVLGVLALRDLKLNPHKRGMGRALTGIVMGGLATLVL